MQAVKKNEGQVECGGGEEGGAWGGWIFSLVIHGENVPQFKFVL